MSKKLIIIRHGNTFLPGEEPRRVGGRTDLDLVEKVKSRKAGVYLQENNLIPNKIIYGPLKRHKQTAEIICDSFPSKIPLEMTCEFNEIDYGEDENKPESEVLARVGKKALALWDEKNIPPLGWHVDEEVMRKSWCKLASQIGSNETIVVVSSNGMIRFVDVLLKKNPDSLKVKTGSISLLEYDGQEWIIRLWNHLP